MIQLDVWLTLPAGKNIKAGTLVTAEPDEIRGGIEGQFRYDLDYLEHPEAFALDPFHLPLNNEIFNAHRPLAGVHGVFEDNLPDDWGRRLMARRYNLSRTEQRVPDLLRLIGNQGLGALSFTEQGRIDIKTTGVSSHKLQELMHQAKIFEQGPMATADELAELFRAGSSPGGARPKALIDDGGVPCLGKFGSIKDQVDVVGLEAAAMDLARQAGIETPATRLVKLATGKCLLIERFDINEAGGRNHLISMQSLLKADGYYNTSYRDLAEVIRHISVQPGQDILHLFRQMVFNVMIGNTDDHLKNFLMLHDEAGYRLSPSFDLVPDIGFNRDHILRIGFDIKVPDGETLLNEARHFGINRRSRAKDLIMALHETVANWQVVFSQCQVPELDSQLIGKDISQRLLKTSSFK